MKKLFALLLAVAMTFGLLTLPASAEEEPQGPFEDVSIAVSYYPAVMWAYTHQLQITNGVDATHFAPEKTVTRGQAATFLWRAMNCPEPQTTQNPFADVGETSYYYKAVLWANENNITNGTDAAHFSPDKTCSTAHMATFLFRTLNPDEVKKGNNGWYETARDWCRNHGIMAAVMMPCSPEFDCSRAIVAEYLYDAFASGATIPDGMSATLRIDAGEVDPATGMPEFTFTLEVTGGTAPYTLKWMHMALGEEFGTNSAPTDKGMTAEETATGAVFKGPIGHAGAPVKVIVTDVAGQVAETESVLIGGGGMG